MKKVLLSLGILIGTVAFAQSTNSPKFGTKAGVNVYNVTAGNTKSKPGFYVGGFIEAPLSSLFSIQPEIVYSYQNFLEEGAVEIMNTTVKNARYSFGYINVPVMLKYYAVPDRFYIEAGPELGFLLSSEFKVDVYSATGNATGNKNAKEFFTDFNFGLGLGLGYRFTPKFGANLRYTLGLTSLTKDSNAEAIKNRNFQLGLNYTFK